MTASIMRLSFKNDDTENYFAQDKTKKYVHVISHSRKHTIRLSSAAR